MKIFALLLVCTFHRIRASEDGLKEAINRGVADILEQQDILKKQYLNTQEVAISAVDKANTNFSEETVQIFKYFKDQAQLTALDAFQVAYDRLFAESKQSAQKISERIPKLIAETYVPLKIAQDAYHKVYNEIEALKAIASGKVISSGSTAINGVTYCISSGPSSVPRSPIGIRYIKNEIPRFTSQIISLVKRCQYEVGPNCIETVTAKIATETEKVKKIGEGSAEGSVLLEEDFIRSCVSRKMHVFEKHAKKVAEKITQI